MSNVLKNLRSLSQMEFYKKGLKIRNDITLWMLRDFGTKRNPKNVKQVIKNISNEDKETINKIYEKYNYNPNKEYQSEYPEWFVNLEKNRLFNICAEMMKHIITANTIYPVLDAEWDMRRCEQDEAIGCCYILYQEIQHLTTMLPNDLNKMVYLLEDIELEITLLKGWRQSDNNKRKKK